jgi:alkyl hydroperoxide reductase subunit D
MHLDALLEAVPAYARDLKLNFSAVIRQNTELTDQQLWGTVVACAIASRNRELIDAVIAEAQTKLSAQALEAAKGAAAVLSMITFSTASNISRRIRSTKPCAPDCA